MRYLERRKSGKIKFEEKVDCYCIIMPNPIIRSDISGGHLALFSKIQDYVEAVENLLMKGGN